MEFAAYLAPVAFVFALAALARLNELKKQIEQLKTDIRQLKDKEDQNPGLE